MEIIVMLKDIPDIGDVITITCGSKVEMMDTVDYILSKCNKPPSED